MKNQAMLQLSAIKLPLLCLSLALGCAHWAEAAPVGSVTHLSGPLFAQKADGTVKALGQGSAIDAGDTLVTQDGTYARIKLKDEAEMVLRPNTQLQVRQYVYDQARPQDDNAVMRLLKGSFRTVTGWIGKRSSRDAYRMETPTATIGIRGTDYDATHCPSLASCGMAEGPLATEPLQEETTFLQNHAGGNTISNSLGTQNVGPGQIAEAGRTTPPGLITLPVPPARLFPPPPPSVGDPGTPPPATGGSLGPDLSCRMR